MAEVVDLSPVRTERSAVAASEYRGRGEHTCTLESV